MRIHILQCFFSILTMICVLGCQNSATVTSQTQAMLQQQQMLTAQKEELRNRAAALDRDNQELETLLAQSRQQSQLLEDQLTAVRDQLQSTNTQLADLRSERQGLQQQTKALAASVERRAQATIRPNNSLVGDLSVIHLPGIEVRQDGDLVRIELPADRLFHRGGVAMQTSAQQMLDGVMADVLRNYPDQLIGIEGHTDSDPISTGQFPSNHHLSLARATAVYDYLVGRLRAPRDQFILVGHGANHPVVSNATPAGKQRNRRVELVVYPETFR